MWGMLRTKCFRHQFRHTQRNCGYAPRCVACGGSHLSGGCSTPREQPQCCGCGGNHTANYRGCVKWKEARAALAKQAPQRAPRNAPAAPKAQQAGPSAEQLALGEGWSHVVRGGRVAKATATPPPIHPNLPPQPVTGVPGQPKVTATRKKAGPKKPETKPKAAAQPAAGKSKKKVVASVKTAATKPTTPVLVVPNQSDGCQQTSRGYR